MNEHWQSTLKSGMDSYENQHPHHSIINNNDNVPLKSNKKKERLAKHFHG